MNRKLTVLTILKIKQMETKKVTIEIPVGKQAKWVNGVLTLVDEAPKDITERIKTFEDAVEALGSNHTFVQQWNAVKSAFTGDEERKVCLFPDTVDITAYLKLRIITAALNEGWEPQFVKGEKRWYFWYDLITKEQYDKLSAEDKSRVVGRGGSNAYAYFGLVCSFALNASSHSYSSYGSRLAFKSEKLAAYAGKQFAEIYADFCFKPKSDIESVK